LRYRESSTPRQTGRFSRQRPKLRALSNYPATTGGQRGIRTLEGLLTLTPLAGVRLRPLGHLSVLRTCRRKRKLIRRLRAWSRCFHVTAALSCGGDMILPLAGGVTRKASGDLPAGWPVVALPGKRNRAHQSFARRWSREIEKVFFRRRRTRRSASIRLANRPAARA
jgi:hypothetical protein